MSFDLEFGICRKVFLWAGRRRFGWMFKWVKNEEEIKGPDLSLI